MTALEYRLDRLPFSRQMVCSHCSSMLRDTYFSGMA
jgi:hypothetical protein